MSTPRLRHGWTTDPEEVHHLMVCWGRAVPAYRIYFRDEHGVIIGRDDYEAADHEHALAVARCLANACSDICRGTEVWQGIKRVDAGPPPPSGLTLSEIVANAQEIALERELALQQSNWMIADSTRLLTATQRLLDQIGRRSP